MKKNQNYLRENKLDKGYETNDFTIFLKAQKGEDGKDVSNWAIPELEQVVKEFISLVGEPKKTESQNVIIYFYLITYTFIIINIIIISTFIKIF